MDHVDYVKALAQKYHGRFAPSNYEDLVGAGTVGLIQAVDRFDASRDLKFRTYARHRIAGAMLDHLRTQDPLKRADRRRQRLGESFVSEGQSGCGAPRTISLDALPSGVVDLLLLRSAQSTMGTPLRDALKEARRQLLPQEARVITLLFDCGVQGRDVAFAMGVSEGYVSAIKRRALEKIRSQLN